MMIRMDEERSSGLQRHFPNHQQEPAALNAKSDGYAADAEASINLFPEERQTEKIRDVKKETGVTSGKKSGKRSRKKPEVEDETDSRDDFHPAECTAALQYFLSDSASVWNKVESIIDEVLVQYRK